MNAPGICKPCRESLRTTVLRTGIIALVIGGAISWRAGLARWPIATLLVLWPAFGGHWVERFFLNWLRPRISGARPVQVMARLGVWFAGGILLFIGMRLTAFAVGGFHRMRWPGLWMGGIAFIGIELIVHLFLQLRGRPSFYNGRG